MGEDSGTQRPMRGSFPGGPSEDGSALDARRLRTVEDAERSDDEARLRRRRRRSLRALMIVSVVGLLGAVVGGLWVGFSGPDESVPRVETAPGTVDEVLRQERNRILAELWKMESLETIRR